MITVLFVDDEVRVLEAIERSLGLLVDEWEILCAGGGRDALQVLETQDVDVVVTDMRMPGMDGASLLESMRRDHPSVIRFVLSGQMDQATALRALPLAQQFLSKPCAAEELHAQIERVLEVRNYLDDRRLQAFVGQVARLPTVPTHYKELDLALRDPSAQLPRIVALVERDPALVARIVQLANSAFFARNQPVATVDRALQRLGVDLVRTLALAGIFEGATSTTSDVRLLQARAVQRAVLGHRAAPPLLRERVSLACLLAEVGALVLAAADAPFVEEPPPTARPTAAKVGAYLLGLWAFPSDVVAAVADASLAPGPSDPTDDVRALTYLASLVLDHGSLPPSLAHDERWVEAFSKTHSLAEITT